MLYGNACDAIDMSDIPTSGARRIARTLRLFVLNWRPIGSAVVYFTVEIDPVVHGKVGIRNPQGRVFESGWTLTPCKTKIRLGDHVLALSEKERM